MQVVWKLVRMNASLRCLVRSLLLLSALSSAVAVAPWEVWDDCKLEADKYFDGDSFHVRRGRASVIIRLYFVDAPELTSSYAQIVAEQAAYFRTKAPAVLHGGEKAKALTEAFLATPFQVITRRQIAPGASRSARIYGVVQRDGKRLDATLVAAGLARVHGERADYPSAESREETVTRLRELELQAARARRGLWQESGYVELLKDALQTRSFKPLTGVVGLRQPRRISINHGSADELTSLPGIGPKLAAAIIQLRPYKTIEALENVPGIGPKKLAEMRDLVTID